MESFESANAVVYGISTDKPAKLRKWKEKKSFAYDFLSDPEHQLLEPLGAWSEKSLFGKKYMGVTRSHWIFDEAGKVLDVQIKVSPKDSVKRAKAFLGDE